MATHYFLSSTNLPNKDVKTRFTAFVDQSEMTAFFGGVLAIFGIFGLVALGFGSVYAGYACIKSSRPENNEGRRRYGLLLLAILLLAAGLIGLGYAKTGGGPPR